MSDEEIKKALECCVANENCKKCPLAEDRLCFRSLKEKALDLINRQQAEIDDLKRDTVPKLQDSLNRANKYGRATDRENARLKAEVERLQSLCTAKDVIIKEQEAEIERLNGNLFTISNACMQRRNEAIKEFAERLRKEVANTWFGVCCTGETEEYKEGCLHGLVAKQKHCLCSIKNLVAEMVGGENA